MDPRQASSGLRRAVEVLEEESAVEIASYAKPWVSW